MAAASSKKPAADVETPETEKASAGTFETEIRPVPDEHDIVNEAVLTDSAEAHIDRVAMPSLKADGTPDQTPGYEVISPDYDPENRNV